MVLRVMATSRSPGTHLHSRATPMPTCGSGRIVARGIIAGRRRRIGNESSSSAAADLNLNLKRRRSHQSRDFRRGGLALPCRAGAGEVSSSKVDAGNNVVGSKSLGVVITGSTKGVGLALAEAFLEQGDRVAICSRNEENVRLKVKELQQRFGPSKVVGRACNVAKAGQVKDFALFAKAELGQIDVWINNAGSNGYQFTPLMDSDTDKLQEIVETNTLGLMFCMKEAMDVMRSQEGVIGHIFNMDGAGTSGSATPRFAAYGATKRAITQLNKSLQAELGMLGIKNIVLHMLSPGMVTTELLMSGSDTKIAKFMINALAEEPREVAAFLVPRVREVCLASSEAHAGGEGSPVQKDDAATASFKAFLEKFGGSSKYIKYLTLPKAFLQIFLKAALGIRNNRWVEE